MSDELIGTEIAFGVEAIPTIGTKFFGKICALGPISAGFTALPLLAASRM